MPSPTRLRLGQAYAFTQCGAALSPLYPLAVWVGLDNPPADALQALLVPRTDLVPLGASSGFSFLEAPTAEQIRASAILDQSGIAHIDFRIGQERWSPGAAAGTSAQLFSFADPVFASVFQFSEVAGLDLSTVCWGEIGCDDSVLGRTEWEEMEETNRGLDFDAGCDLIGVWLEEACGLRVPLQPCPAAGYELVADATGDGVFSVWATSTSRVRCRLETGMTMRLSSDVGLNVRVEGSPMEAFLKGDLPSSADPQYPIYPEAGLSATWQLWNWCGEPVSAVIETKAGRTEINVVTECVEAADLALVGLVAGEGPPPTDAETRTVERFVEFARQPTAGSLENVPFADRVALGLGPTLVEVRPVEELVDSANWWLHQDGYRADTGPFSAVDFIARHDGAFDLQVGPHPHCASPSPSPLGFEHHRRLSYQPQATLSCLDWFTIDLFLGPRGEIEAVTLDAFTP